MFQEGQEVKLGRILNKQRCCHMAIFFCPGSDVACSYCFLLQWSCGNNLAMLEFCIRESLGWNHSYFCRFLWSYIWALNQQNKRRRLLDQ